MTKEQPQQTKETRRHAGQAPWHFDRMDIQRRLERKERRQAFSTGVAGWCIIIMAIIVMATVVDAGRGLIMAIFYSAGGGA